MSNMSKCIGQFRDIVFGEGHAPTNRPSENESYYCTWFDGCSETKSMLTWGTGLPPHVHGHALCEEHAHQVFSDDELVKLLAGTLLSAKYSREERKQYVAAMLEDGSTDVTFESFETYAEALACVEAQQYKSWIIGPSFIEDHS